MNKHSIKSISIVGGGLSGWSAALILAKSIEGTGISVSLIEENENSIEFPWLQANSASYHQRLGIDEKSLLKHSEGTFSLGTHYHAWQNSEHSYFQPFGAHGSVINFVDFHHLIVKQKLEGENPQYDQYAFASSVAKAGKFMHPQPQQQSLMSVLDYSHNFDPQLYLNYIKQTAKSLGVTEINASVTQINLAEDSNQIKSINLSNDKTISSDFYFDNSGLNATLLSQQQKSTRQSWQQFMPFDSKIVCSRKANLEESKPQNNVYCTSHGYIRSYTTQSKEYIEYIFDSAKLSQEKVLGYLGDKYPGAKQLGELTRITPGQQSRHWTENCLAIGQAAVDFCPLELSSVYTVQESIYLFLELFPNLDCLQELSSEYNRIFTQRMENLRDYISLHFVALTDTANQTDWIAEISSSLQKKLDLFKASGKIPFAEGEVFASSLWVSTLLGLNFWPDSYDQFLNGFDSAALSNNYQQMLDAIKHTTPQLPNHLDYLQSGLK
jgi:tryptophan 7-halogenase